MEVRVCFPQTTMNNVIGPHQSSGSRWSWAYFSSGWCWITLSPDPNTRLCYEVCFKVRHQPQVSANIQPRMSWKSWKETLLTIRNSFLIFPWTMSSWLTALFNQSLSFRHQSKSYHLSTLGFTPPSFTYFYFRLCHISDPICLSFTRCLHFFRLFILHVTLGVRSFSLSSELDVTAQNRASFDSTLQTAVFLPSYVVRPLIITCIHFFPHLFLCPFYQIVLGRHCPCGVRKALPLVFFSIFSTVTMREWCKRIPGCPLLPPPPSFTTLPSHASCCHSFLTLCFFKDKIYGC